MTKTLENHNIDWIENRRKEYWSCPCLETCCNDPDIWWPSCDDTGGECVNGPNCDYCLMCFGRTACKTCEAECGCEE